MKTHRSSSRILLCLTLCAGLDCFVLASRVSSAAPVTKPGGGYLAGGYEVQFDIRYDFSNLTTYSPTVYFGGIVSPHAYFVEVYVYDDSGEVLLDEWNWLRCVVPASTGGGPADVRLEFTPLSVEVPEKEPRLYDEGFVYYAAPELIDLVPADYSILPEDLPVKIRARGLATTGPVSVFFGDRPAAEVVVRSDGTELTCLPPDFAGGTWPLSVDVRVVNPAGETLTVPNGFVYHPIAPAVIYTSGPNSAWKSRQGILITLDRIVKGKFFAFIDGIPIDGLIISPTYVDKLVGRRPALPPGSYDLIVVNGDGGITFLEDAVEYEGPANTDFHPGDRDQDFRFNLSEVLRVVQFYNSGGLHCDPNSEDGYAPGVGADTSCAPYPADNAPFNWNLGLTELLGIIQFYNLHCYQPCPAAPGTYCPPD